MEMAKKVKRSGFRKSILEVLPFSLYYSSSAHNLWVFRAALDLQTHSYFPPTVKQALNLQTYGYFPSTVKQYNFILDLSNCEC